RPIQQLIGQATNHDSQYQCGQPLFQFGIVAPIPIASPRTKNQSTWRVARPGAKRAQSHAQKIEITMKNVALAIRAEFEGTRPLTKSPGNKRESSGSVPSTRATESR